MVDGGFIENDDDFVILILLLPLEGLSELVLILVVPSVVVPEMAVVFVVLLMVAVLDLVPKQNRGQGFEGYVLDDEEWGAVA